MLAGYGRMTPFYSWNLQAKLVIFKVYVRSPLVAFPIALAMCPCLMNLKPVALLCSMELRQAKLVPVAFYNLYMCLCFIAGGISFSGICICPED
jgi:hypothetical protein